MRPQTRPKFRIPGIAVIAIIVILIGLGVKGSKYVANHSAEKQQSRASQKAKSAEMARSMTLSSFGSMQQDRSLSDYDVIAETNLLKPLGWQKIVAVPPPPRPIIQREIRQRSPEPANDLVFTGIVHLGDAPIALIEDISSGEAYFLKEGDVLKDYVVEAIGEESIILVNGNSRLMPDLGSKTYYSSSGQILASGVIDDQTTGDLAKSTDTEPASLDKNLANLSMIERMRAKRREELGQD